MPNYFPVMLDVRGRSAVVVGGDRIAAEKALALRESGAVVSVVSPTFCRALRELGASDALTLRRKAYESGDLDGAFVVVVVATDDAELVERIWAETRRNGQLVNIVDVPERCSYIVPSILRRGQLTIAVSTEGASPSLAKRVRRRLEDLFPPEYGSYLRLATAARARLRAGGVSYTRRDLFFGEYMESDVLERIAAGDVAGAAATTAELLRRYGVEAPAAALAEAC